MWGRVGAEEGGLVAARLEALRRLVLLTLAFEAWVVIGYHPYSDTPVVYAAAACLLTACAALGWRKRFAWLATLIALEVELATIVSAFPTSANHQFLAVILLWLVLLAGRDPAGDSRAACAETCLQSVRWIVVAGFVWAGVMKLISGYWLGAEFLSYRIAVDPEFAWVLGPILSDAELTRLVALENRIGAGPFRADSELLPLVSNLTWMAEIALPIALLFARTRRIAVVLCLLLLAAIQLGAREIFFAGLMSGSLLLFLDQNWLARVLPLYGTVYALFLLQTWGLL